MNRKSLYLAVALSLPAGAVLAQGASPTGISWSYFDIGVQHVNLDDSRVDNSLGPVVRGSGMINPNWHVFLGWNRFQLKGSESFVGENGEPGVSRVDDSVDRFHVGIGYNLQIGASSDLFTRVAWERVGSADYRVSVGDQSFDSKLDKSDGWSVEVGVRNAFTPRFEGGASVRYTRLDGTGVQSLSSAGLTSDSSTALILLGQYKFGNGWGIVGEGDISSDYQSLFVGARLSY